MNTGDGMQQAGFPTQMQRPMQPSPMPPSQQSNVMDPSQLQQGSMLQQMPNTNQGQAQNFQQNGQGQSGEPSLQQMQEHARNLYQRMPDEKKNQIRMTMMRNSTDQQRAAAAAQGGDPHVMNFLLAKSKEMLKSKMGQQGGQQNMGFGNGQQAASSQPDYATFISQQANAMKHQESGEQVVPASNNTDFMNNRGMNMPQGINPQMLGNQGNPQMTNQMQQIALQQQKQAMMQRQNMLAQQQAMQQQQQANQLRGQPGGLNAPNALNGGPAGQVNSPAMSMLNRPMAPPNQAPNTPQQQNQAPNQQGPPTPQNAATLNLLQHHQQMMHQNNPQMHQGPGQQPMNEQQSMQVMQMLRSLPPQHRQRLMQMKPTPEQLSQFVRNFNMQRQQGQAQQNGNMMNGQPDQQGPGPNMGMPMGQPPPGMMNNMQANATPMYNSQPPQNPQGFPLDATQMQQRANQQQQHAQLRQRAIDSWKFPNELRAQLPIPLPQEVQSWGRLKEHLMQNSNMVPPGILQRVQQAQGQWFESHPEELNQAFQALKQRLMQQNQAARMGPMSGPPLQPQPPAAGPSGMGMPNGQAPPAQMVPPAGGMQQPQRMPNQGPPPPGNAQAGLRPPNPPQPPSIQEIQALRSKHQQLQGKSDDEIKGFIWNQKQKNYANALQQFQQQEALRSAQMQRAQQFITSQGGMPAQGVAGQRPSQPPQQTGTPQQGQKRPQPPSSGDDVVEIPNPNQRQQQQQQPMGATQAPPMQPSQSQQQNRQQPPQMPTQEQIAKLPQDQQAKFAAFQRRQQAEALKKAQMGLGNANQGQQPAQQSQGQQQGQQQNQQQGQQQGLNGAAGPRQPEAVRAKFNAIQEDLHRRCPKGPPLHLEPEEKQQAQTIMRRLWTQMARLWASMLPALQQFPQLENQIRATMKAVYQYRQNCADPNGNIKDYLSLSVADLKEIENTAQQYFVQIKTAKDAAQQNRQMGGQAAGQQQPAQAKPQQPSQAVPTPPPQQQQQQQQSQGKKGSTNNKPPPAPTENKTFDWGATSPHGVPKYELARSELSQDKLKLPANKRRKPNQEDSQVSTPAGQTATPGAAVASPSLPQNKQALSPDQIKKQQAALKQEKEKIEAPKFPCSDKLCEWSVRGFENEEERKKHEEAEHGFVDDALAFLLEQGEKVAPSKGDKAEAAPAHGAAKPRPKASQTPGVKAELTTPAMQGVKPVEKPTAAAEKTLQEFIEQEKMGYTHQPAPASPATQALADTLANGTVNDEASWQAMLSDSFNPSVAPFIDDWSTFGMDGNTVDWGLRPEGTTESSPELTPSSGTSTGSSRESDISQSERLRINMEWDPWGTGDTQIPEALKEMMDLGLGGGGGNGSPSGAQQQQQAKKDGTNKDVNMADAESKGEQHDAEKVKIATGDEWDWSQDQILNGDLDGLFGTQGGALDEVNWDL
ncbi:hypothetical protein D0864_12774 [Hortaea werneckii]|uniref:Mediator complex subunit 15 KIX domain-containing protein n=1 Tax=Hortaea werneckii TaxID=91943 RepID=A0A3M7DEC8_HORWE|nr:hypothetical protein D0864_12774 [Hortaea werneckii]